MFFFRQNNFYAYRPVHRPHQNLSWHFGNNPQFLETSNSGVKVSDPDFPI